MSELRSRSQRLVSTLVGRAAARLLRVWASTWRVTTDGPDPLHPQHEAIVAAFWHRNILMAAWYYRDRAFSVAVSRSKDGDLIAAALAGLRYRRAARGSSTRGGAAALRELHRLVTSGVTVSVQTDGPQGPPRVSKIGIATLARLTGRPMQPVAFSARPAVRFRSWDQTLLPLPFARLHCRYGDPIPVDALGDEAAEEAARAKLDVALNQLTDDLDALLGRNTRRRGPG